MARQSDIEPSNTGPIEGRSRLAQAWARVYGFLTGYSTLAGIGLLPLPAAVIALLVGWAGDKITLALVIALVISLAVNAVIGVTIWRRGLWRGRGLRGMTPRKSWYRDQNDLDSLFLTSADLESWWANAMRVAREQAGPDAEAYVESIHIHPSPFIALRGQSATALRTFAGTVSGTNATDVSWYGINRVDAVARSNFPQPLWRTDDTWRELISKAWLRERPVRSGGVLYDRSSRTGRRWELHFGPYQTDDQRLIRGRVYWIENGQLQVHNT